MKNITLSMDDETYRLARVAAAERDQSVSAMVRDLIRDATSKSGVSVEDKNARLFAAFDAIKGVDASKRMKRDEVYDRSRRT
jgi:plasmid stability protein